LKQNFFTTNNWLKAVEQERTEDYSGIAEAKGRHNRAGRTGQAEPLQLRLDLWLRGAGLLPTEKIPVAAHGKTQSNIVTAMAAYSYVAADTDP
jgi:hypothetical protein